MIETYELGEVIRSGRPIMDEAIIEYAKKNDKFCLVSPDMTRAAFPNFMNTCKEQHFNVGIAENSAVDIASGLALEGYVPFIYGMSAFLSMRSFEAIRTNVGYQNHNVKFIACNTGVSLGMLGSTHYAMEDLALISSIPNMTVICPGDPDQTVKAFHAAAEMQGPVYIRMANGRNESAVYKEDYEFEIGKGITIMEGDDCAIVATGIMVLYERGLVDIYAPLYKTLKCAENLDKRITILNLLHHTSGLQEIASALTLSYNDTVNFDKEEASNCLVHAEEFIAEARRFL